MDRPAAIEIAIWLNQFKSGMISKSDTINALETITQSAEYEEMGTINGWTKLVDQLALHPQPVFALLPSSGHPAGIPLEILKISNVHFGFIALPKNRVLFLARSLANDLTLQSWKVDSLKMPLSNPDPKAIRQELLTNLNDSVLLLANLDLLGERESIDKKLDQTKLVHLPPALSTKVISDLDLAQRVWLICDEALKNTQAAASPSSDRLRISSLNTLKHLAIALLSATTVNS